MVVVAVAVLGIGAVAATGRLGAMAEEPVRDTYRQRLPEGLLGQADIRRLRFGVVPRGYAMDQVDAVLERLGREVAERDTRIAALADELDERRAQLGPQQR